ncbi:MAG: CotH kinase family protein [Planctomycetes bacterium]|nr:CotH kinase family protein [Planctomycetota bacterium]
MRQIIAIAILLSLASRSLLWCGPVFHEILPDPPAGLPEFIEIHNPASAPCDLSEACLSAGRVFLAFSSGQRIAARGYLVLTSDADLFIDAYGFPAGGVYEGSLPDGEGRLELLRAGQTIARAAYRIDPEDRAPQSGASLELRGPELDGTDPASWEPSLRRGGTPGSDNDARLRFDALPIVPLGSSWKYLPGRAEPSAEPLGWTLAGFDDSGWLSGRATIGYGNFDDETVLDDMRGGYSTVYLRCSFSFHRRGEVLDLLFSALFDDGFVAYLNGVEIARRNLGAEGEIIPHDGAAAAPQTLEGVREEIRILERQDLLAGGINVLAVHAANDHVRGSDFAIHPALAAILSRRPRPSPLDVKLNEVWTIDGVTAGLEILNLAGETVDLGGLRVLSSFGGDGATIPAGTVLGPRGFAALEMPADLAAGTIALLDPDEGLILDSARFPPFADGGSAGRFPDGSGALRSLADATPGAANASPRPGAAAIAEIHYHPAPESEEFVEILARGEIDLDGWKLAGAVDYIFPPLGLEAGQRAVVARRPERMPDTGGAAVLGPWLGRLANSAETLLLLDDGGREVDRVRYADDGGWPPAADGEGPSLELVQSEIENESPLAWRASRAPGGTPGAPNSIADLDPFPVVDLVSHAPVLPRSEDSVTVSARIAPAEASAEILYRLDGESVFQRIAMEPRGDLRAAEIPPLPSGSLVEFAVEASWQIAGEPAPIVSRFPASAPGTCLYEVDDRQDALLVRTYRLLFRQSDHARLLEDITADDFYPATFVGLGRAYHDVTARFRGHGSRFVDPKSYHVRFTQENPFPDGTRIFLNGFRPERQVMGMDLWRRAGMTYSRARIVHLIAGGRFYPHYAQMEPIDDAYLERHFGEDGPGGNLYRGLRTADLSYLGEDPAAYRDIYEKRTNEEIADWSDIVDLCRAFSSSADEVFPEEIARRIEVEEWLRWLAIHEILSNQEGGLHRDTGDDYFIYRPPGGRFLLLPWDMDSTWLEPRQRIFRPSVPAIRRLITHPRLAPLYYRQLREILDAHFTPEAAARQSALLEAAYPASVAEELVTYARERSAFIERSIPRRLTVEALDGGWGCGSAIHALDGELVLGGRAPPIETAQVLVGRRPAAYDPAQASWTLLLPVAETPLLTLVEAVDPEGLVRSRIETVVDRITPAHVVTELAPGRSELLRTGSPHILEGDIDLEPESELVIGEGAEVLFAPGAVLSVAGTLRAVGTAERRIRLGAGRPAAGGGGGLRLLAGGAAELSFCDVGGEAIAPAAAAEPEPWLLLSEASARLSQCRFRGVPGVVIEAVESDLEVADSIFIETGEAVHGVRSRVAVLRTRIESVRGNSDAIDLDEEHPEGGESRIEECTILGGDDDGIDLLSVRCRIADNLILGCADRGISIEGPAPVTIEGNIAADCEDGIAVKDGAVAAGGHNTIARCSTGLRVFAKTPGADGAEAELHSSILWQNERAVFVDSASHLRLDACDIGGDAEAWGEGNFSADPLFAGANDFRLGAGSPCLGRGLGGTDVGARGMAEDAAPTIACVEPAAGPVEGGEIVTIRGSGLESAQEVRIGGQAAGEITILAGGSLQAVVPPARRAGPASVEVVTDRGRAVQPAGYSYALRLRRGDADGDLRVGISDCVAIIRLSIHGAPLPLCDAVADVNEDLEVEIADSVHLLQILFLGRRWPSEPFVDCEPPAAGASDGKRALRDHLRRPEAGGDGGGSLAVSKTPAGSGEEP